MRTKKGCCLVSPAIDTTPSFADLHCQALAQRRRPRRIGFLISRMTPRAIVRNLDLPAGSNDPSCMASTTVTGIGFPASLPLLSPPGTEARAIGSWRCMLLVCIATEPCTLNLHPCRGG